MLGKLTHRMEIKVMEQILIREENRTNEELARENHALKKLLEQTSGRINHLQYLYQISQIENSKHREKCESDKKTIAELKLQIENIQNSTCWRITAPLRKIINFVRKK